MNHHTGAVDDGTKIGLELAGQTGFKHWHQGIPVKIGSHHRRLGEDLFPKFRQQLTDTTLDHNRRCFRALNPSQKLVHLGNQAQQFLLGGTGPGGLSYIGHQLSPSRSLRIPYGPNVDNS